MKQLVKHLDLWSTEKPIREIKKLYIGLEEVDLIWCEYKLKEIILLWNRGYGYIFMAEHFNRTAEDMQAILLDLDIKRKLIFRAGGIHGSK